MKVIWFFFFIYPAYQVKQSSLCNYKWESPMCEIQFFLSRVHLKSSSETLEIMSTSLMD